MKKLLLQILIVISFGAILIGCSEAVHEYKEIDPHSRISEIGSDLNGNPVYVREIVIKRDTDYRTIFIQCTKDGTILPGTVSN